MTSPVQGIQLDVTCCRERKRTPTPPSVLKTEEDKLKEEVVEELDTKKEPLSLEELLAKKQAEEAARSKVSHHTWSGIGMYPPDTCLQSIETLESIEIELSDSLVAFISCRQKLRTC